MRITYMGHSCFFIEGDKTVVTDPFRDIGYPLKTLRCDVCLSTHDHFDHNAVDLVKTHRRVKGLLDLTKGKIVNIAAIPCYHDGFFGKLRGGNLIYKFEVNGVVFAHFGDLGGVFDPSMAERVEPVDIAFIPVGGNYTIDCETAAAYAKAIKAKVVIPMHYKTPRSNIDISDKSAFLAEFDKIETFDSSVEFEKETLPNDLTVWTFNDENY